MTTEVLSEQEFNIEVEQDVFGLYQFGAATSKHCGIYPFHQPSRTPGHYRVNIACLDDTDPYSLDVEIFDVRHLL